jgi:hypothetical protein
MADDLHPIGNTSSPQPGYAERRAAQEPPAREPYVAPPREIKPYDPAARSREQHQGAPPAADGKTAAETGKTGERVKVGEYDLSPEDVAGLLERKSQEELRKTQIPDAPEKYTATLPEAFKLPDGMTFKFDEASPEYLAARTWAHAQGFSQKQFSELLSFHANTQAAEAVKIGSAARAEVEKLGSAGTARVTAVEQFLRGMVGDELAGHLRGMMVTAKIVQGFEKLMTKHSSQGVANFRQDGRDTPAASGSIPGYEKMTYAQRREAQDVTSRRR